MRARKYVSIYALVCVQQTATKGSQNAAILVNNVEPVLSDVLGQGASSTTPSSLENLYTCMLQRQLVFRAYLELCFKNLVNNVVENIIDQNI